MKKNSLKFNDQVVIEREGLQRMLEILNRQGYQTIGPTIHDNVVIYDELKSVTELPIGWNDEQGPGMYRLRKSNTATLFGYVVGSYSWKKYLYPPAIQLWRSKREVSGFQVIEEKREFPKYAFIGVRSCEISAIHALDKVFNSREFSDSIYNGIREQAVIIAVNCTRPGGTCFCTSMNTGPKATSGFDIALTEVLDNGRHYFLAEVGSEKGAVVFNKINNKEATEKEKRVARSILEKASGQMGRTLNTSNLKVIFYENFDYPQWEKLSQRCLTCGNCTMVCPTCFCNTVEDVTSLNGDRAERWRKWDSCFTKDFSYIHGGSIRASEKSRYRQWVTHKLVTWKDQFGSLGCVGCGRCITWCPVGIDITEGAKAIMVKTASSDS